MANAYTELFNWITLFLIFENIGAFTLTMFSGVVAVFMWLLFNFLPSLLVIVALAFLKKTMSKKDLAKKSS